MMLKRTMDATFLNVVANHEAVRRSFPWPGEINMSAVMNVPGSVAFSDRDGFFLFKPSAPAIYEVDTMYLPSASARAIRKAAKTVAGVMFDAYGAERLNLLTLRSNVPARQLAVWVGFRKVCDQTRTVRGHVCDLIYMTLDAHSFRKAH